jgi:hypothetical protein
MPSSEGKKPRIPRCSYKEGGRRCIRNAVDGSTPALCNAHRVLFADMGRPPERSRSSVRDELADVLGDLLAGNKVSRDRIESVASELMGGAWNLGGIMGGYMPNIPHVPPNPNARPWSGAFAGAFRGAGRPPPVDPQVIEMADLRRAARIELGFAATEPLSLEQLKATHKKLVITHHPDRGKDDVDRRRRTEKMMRINAANDILVDELDPERAKRREQQG